MPVQYSVLQNTTDTELLPTAHPLTLPAANFCAVVQSPKLPGSSGLLHFFLAALAAVLASSKSQVSSRAGRPVKQSQVGAFRQSWGEIVD